MLIYEPIHFRLRLMEIEQNPITNERLEIVKTHNKEEHDQLLE